MNHFVGHVGFRPERNVCLPTQLGACSHPTGRTTVPYWCTIDVRTPWARHGVPTGPPGPRRAPTAARRPAGGSVQLIFIGGPRFGRPAAPIGAGRRCSQASTFMLGFGLGLNGCSCSALLRLNGCSVQPHVRTEHRSAGLGRTRLFHPWGREPEVGWSGSDVSVSHVVRPGLSWTQVSHL